MLFAHADLYKMLPPPTLGRLHVGRYNLTIPDAMPDPPSTIPRRTPPYLHANTKWHGLSLELGASYMVELIQTNKAGGISRRWWSPAATSSSCPN